MAKANNGNSHHMSPVMQLGVVVIFLAAIVLVAVAYNNWSMTMGY